MASLISSMESNSDTLPELHHRKKRMKTSLETPIHNRNYDGPLVTAKKRWRTETERQIYSSKLLEALRRAQRTSPPASKGSEVRETADRVLASAAKGATRWSRAILARRVRLRMRKVKRAKVTAGRRLRGREEKRLPPLEKKVRALGRLVPGCRKVPLPSLLEEVGDYIAALEMQVKAMTALADILAGTAGVPTPVNSQS